MRVYLDESGDLGWTLDKPYRRGGSSKFLTLAFAFIPLAHRNVPKNLIKSMYSHHGWVGEMKASMAHGSQKTLFCNKVELMKQRHPDIRIETITVKKDKVQSHIRDDGNKLYNYMTALVMVDRITSLPEVELIPDMRSIKVSSGNSLHDYLQTKVWFEKNSTCKIKTHPQESKQSYCLQFVDWVAHCVWLHHEDGINEYHDILRPHIHSRHLFF